MFFPIKSKIVLISLTVSIILTILSILLIIQIFPDIIRGQIFKSVRLVKGTEQYDRFLEVPFPITFKVYIFDVENPDKIITGQKPRLREVGPFVYREYWKKNVRNTNEDEDTISYTDQQRFEFDYEASGNLSDTDFVTILNPVMLSILQISEKFGQPTFISNCLTDIMPEISTLFINVTVKDLLFNGLNFCRRHMSLCEFPRNLVCGMVAERKNMDKLKDGSVNFSFFNYKNRSHNTVFTIKRGIKDALTLGEIVALNNFPYTHFWNKLYENSACDLTKGSFANLYPPQISEERTFKVYSEDICRSIEIKFSGESYYKGMKGYMFSTNNLTLRSNTTNKAEDCFCAEQTSGTNGENTCFLDGLVDMQPCYEAPVVLSFPHFLWADDVYLDGVYGLSPSEEKHRTYLLVEPETGTPLESRSRIQINFVLRPIKDIKSTQTLPRVILPLLWVEEGMSLTDEYTAKLKESYFDVVQIVDIVQWALFAGSLLLTIMFGIYYIRKQFSDQL